MSTITLHRSSSRNVNRGYASKLGRAARIFLGALVAVKVPAETAVRVTVVRNAAESSDSLNRIDDGASPLVGQGAWDALAVFPKPQ
ncbi:hypothetical protein BH11PSE11_BH11PSE11_24110 [soil metagenome]